jgi:hypothetical protein
MGELLQWYDETRTTRPESMHLSNLETRCAGGAKYAQEGARQSGFASTGLAASVGPAEPATRRTARLLTPSPIPMRTKNEAL